LANATVKVTFTDPDGVEHPLITTTDSTGSASWTFTPNKAGTWKVMTWYEGQERATSGISYAFSDQVNVEAAYTKTEQQGGGGGTTTTDYTMTYVYAAIAVIAIVIIAAAALLYMRRGKK
jgi:hypothetical protein